MPGCRSFPRSVGVSAALLLAGVASAQALPDPDATAQGEVAVTIYNNGQALVQDVRQLPIAQGRSRIEFPDVSAQIRPETLSFSAPDTAIVEQNFDFDLLTPTKLMEKAIGQTVTLLRTNPATGVETRERARVLSTAGGVVIQIGDRIEVLRDDGLPVRACNDAPGTPKSADEVVAAAGNLVKPRPGLYRSTARLTQIDVPGLPAGQAEQMRAMMGGSEGQTSETCLTEEQAETGFRDFARQLGEGGPGASCEFARFDAAGSKLDAALTCSGPGGVAVDMTMNGTIERESSALTMTMNQKNSALPGGEMKMAMEVTSRRIGDCP
ncbi:DUF3617 family protein [Leptolyngbya sp. 15MV]|nr:DUF3617 family protein [Leptolyngbya sp. 15MV]